MTQGEKQTKLERCSQRDKDRERGDCCKLEFHERDKPINKLWTDGDHNQVHSVLLSLDTLITNLPWMR